MRTHNKRSSSRLKGDKPDKKRYSRDQLQRPAHGQLEQDVHPGLVTALQPVARDLFGDIGKATPARKRRLAGAQRRRAGLGTARLAG